MPYKRVGKNVMVKKGGKWRVKSRCKSIASAGRQVSLLKSKGHGKSGR